MMFARLVQFLLASGFVLSLSRRKGALLPELHGPNRGRT